MDPGTKKQPGIEDIGTTGEIGIWPHVKKKLGTVKFLKCDHGIMIMKENVLYWETYAIIFMSEVAQDLYLTFKWFVRKHLCVYTHAYIHWQLLTLDGGNMVFMLLFLEFKFLHNKNIDKQNTAFKYIPFVYKCTFLTIREGTEH